MLLSLCHYDILLTIFFLLFPLFPLFVIDGEHIFLDFDVKLAKYAPPKWKEEVKSISGCFSLTETKTQLVFK